jgi:uncharacterized protein (TIGR03437 family)
MRSLKAKNYMESRMLRKSWTLALAGTVLSGLLLQVPAVAGTFGKVVAIGGAASDVALDEARGVLYIANFTANRIDVMSLASNTIQTSVNVAAQPSSLSISPDGHWLIVAHYGNNTAPASPQNGLTLIDLTASNAKQTFALGSAPLGVAFGIDNKALVVTTGEFIVFDPIVGSTKTLMTISAAAKQALPAPAATFPPSITGASVASSADYTTIYGLGDNLEFRYDVAHQAMLSYIYTSAPPQGPRAISVAADGSYAASGWTISNFNLQDVAEFPSPAGILNIGGHAVDSVNNLVYSQVATANDTLPQLTIRDADNLTLRSRLQLPENMAGKTAMTRDGSVIYAASDSGVMVLPVGNLNKSAQLISSVSDLVFLGNFCDRNLATKTFTLTAPGGGSVPFSVSSTSTGVSVSPSSGLTPAVITVRVDPNVYSNQKGTSAVSILFASSSAMNVPNPVRVLINSREPDQRGTSVDIPGTLVDLMADSTRNVYYVLRQDLNQVLVFDGSNNTQIATLRTCTTPKSMTATIDNNSLLVGCDAAHIMSVFDLNTLQQLPSIDTGSGYVQSLAASNKAILAVMRDGGGGNPYIARIDTVVRQASKLTSLGVFQNQVLLDTVLVATPNGSRIFVASRDGSTMLYDANVDTFTVSRKDFPSLGGAYAASAFDQFVVGNAVLNSSLVQTSLFETATGTTSGFVFLDNLTGVRTTTPDAVSPGIIQRASIATGTGIRPTRMVEAPLLGIAVPSPVSGTSCVSSTTSTSSTSTCVAGLLFTTTVCSITTVNGTTTSSCKTTSGTITTVPGSVFTRSLAMLQNRTNFVSLTVSGITILPFTYDNAVAPPSISAVVSAADSKSAPAPGGLISLYGNQLSPTNLATKEIPLPTALGNSCLTVNGQPMPLIFVSPNQVNAQMPFQAVGNVTMVVHTPGGVSDNYNVVVPVNAPAVFRSGVAGPLTDVPTVVRNTNNLLATDSNPVHHNDELVIYLTGMGQVSPVVDNGMPAPSDPLAASLVAPTVTLGGVNLPIDYAGLAPGQVGVYQINVSIPKSVPQGLSVPLSISQGFSNNTFDLRVVE